MNPANLIGRANGVKHLHTSNGNTRDIINAILYADKFCAPYTANAAAALKGRNVEETCYNIWKFWKDHVRYVEDPDGVQYIKSPGYLFELGEGDCKSYSVAIASCLQNLRIPYKYRFISEDASKDLHHVYVVVPTSQGEIIIDCVLDNFNVQNAYAKKKDIAPTRSTAAGINGIGTTQAQTIANNWLAYETEFKNNVSARSEALRKRIAASVKEKYKNRLPKVKKAAQQGFEEYYGDTLRLATCLIYVFWDNTKARFPGHSDAPLYDLNSGNSNFWYYTKYQTGLEIYNNIKEAYSISDNDIKELCNIATYNLYGISMDYMLYRCYNMVNYGQPWEPVAGLPYFNFRNNTFVNTGTTAESLAMTVKIAMCFPAAGGVTRPFGKPYLSVGKWFIQNGAPNDMFQEYVKSYSPSAYELQHIANNGAGLSKEYFEEDYALYLTWLSGNMPALPSTLTAPGNQTGSAPNTWTAYDTVPYSTHGNPHFDAPDMEADTGLNGYKKKYKIGLAPGVVESIIAAVVAVVIAVVNIIVKVLLDKQRSTIPNATQIAFPPPDFNLEFQTVDGCFIGTAPAECGNMKAKYCKNGSFTCLTAAELAQPQNQPATPKGGFMGGIGSNGWLLIAGAALLFMGFFSSSKSSNS